LPTRNAEGRKANPTQETQMDKSLAAQFATKIRQQDRELAELKGTIQGIIKSCGEAPRSITEEIDSIPGRRIFYQLSERLSFTISDDGTRGQPMNMLVSQDGPFIQTHYPLVAWKPNLPDNATNFGQWSSVYSWPLPDQERPDRDFLDLSWELIDQGSQRNFQNEPSIPLFSRADGAAAPLPVPTLFSPNTVIAFTPTFEDITFNQTPQVPATGGELVVTLPGFRIANL
jgi:hypothetical protein